MGCLLSGNGSGEWTEGSEQDQFDLVSPNRRCRLNWATRGIQRLPKVLRGESSGCRPKRLPQVDVWSVSGLALLGGKGAGVGPS